MNGDKYRSKMRPPADIRREKRTADLERLMEEYHVKSKGKTLSGHFSPDEAIKVLETAASRERSVSEIITAAVRIGLPTVKKQFPRTRHMRSLKVISSGSE
jgi:hypothetical protein